ncbi:MULTISPECIES: phage tail tube protein [unclassified Agrobacterium]
MTTTSNATLMIGRGELYFDRFAAGTLKGEGELYLGNTPGFTLSRTVEEVERFTSYGGQQIKIGSLITREVQTADITTDNSSMENIALWFGSDPNDVGQLAIGTINESIKVKRGRWYQLGTSAEPFGVRHVEPDIEFTLSGSPVDKLTNFILDRVEGRFYVLDEAPDVDDGETVSVSFQWRTSASVDATESSREVVGALRYISKNPVGPSISYYFPYVRITPASQIDFKTDAWQEFSFEVEIRKLNAATNFLYVKQTAGPLLTQDEQAIVDLGPISLDEFPFYEDLLDQIINVSMPEADYGQVIGYP